MKLIVGLGNPGPKYAGTRHNVGFDVVDAVARQWQIDVTKEKFHAWYGVGLIHHEPVVLLKPATYMNCSGRAVQAAGQFYKLEIDDLLVISDDMALPVGRIRIRSTGSGGGQRGLVDIIERLGSSAWSRLRVGIGEPFGDPSAYVLGRFSKEDAEVITRVRQRAADAVSCWLAEGVDSAMTKYNGNVPEA